MEPTEVWPGIESALHELGMLCSDGNNRVHFKEASEKSRLQLNDMNSSAGIGRCHDRYLLPSQAWNRPGILTEIEGISGQNDSLRSNYQPPDGENTENAYSVKSSRIVKISDLKGGVAFGNASLYSACRSEEIRENDGLNVLRMNSHYMTGVSIAMAGGSGIVFDQSDSYSKYINTHNTPKHVLSAPSLRHHHLRPYEVPWRRDERSRAKSETAEKEAAKKLMDRIDVSLNYPVIYKYSKSNSDKFRRSLLKSRSLENVRLAEDEMLQMPVHEMDSMSNRIQHLHVE